ncbi:hypothetical protein D3C80_2173280 [compost metagenome]
MAVGKQDVVDLLLAQQVLVFSSFEVATGVYKQHVFIGLGLVENQDRRRDACAVKEFFR